MLGSKAGRRSSLVSRKPCFLSRILILKPDSERKQGRKQEDVEVGDVAITSAPAGLAWESRASKEAASSLTVHNSASTLCSSVKGKTRDGGERWNSAAPTLSL